MSTHNFFEASARERANGIVDEGTFHELISPYDRFTSPHLPVLGEAVAFDDGMVTGVGKIGKHPIFVISQEGKFIGGAIGEVNGAKMVGTFQLALDAYQKMMEMHADDIDSYRPFVVISFETGGVRLHEANAGLLAHAEVMDMIQQTKGKVPVVSLIGSKVGCFGGMGFVAAATDVIVMSAEGRLGLTGPEVIEQEIGKEEFDASDKSLISRTTGGKHKYIMQDCNILVENTVEAFRKALCDLTEETYDEICSYRRIGNLGLVREQMALVKTISELAPKDSKDVWRFYGNENAEEIPDLSTEEFLNHVVRR